MSDRRRIRNEPELSLLTRRGCAETLDESYSLDSLLRRFPHRKYINLDSDDLSVNAENRQTAHAGQPSASESSPPAPPSSSHTRMLAFVTVGSTRFDELVQRALSDEVVGGLRQKGYTRLVVQCGNSEFDADLYTHDGDTWTQRRDEGCIVEVWRFKSTLQKEYERADLVVSHAGVLHHFTVLPML